MSDAGFAEAMYDEVYGLNCTIGQLTVENKRLRELCHDMLAVIIGWSWKFNELAGYLPDDEDTYPSRVMRGFIDMARELGVEV